MAPVMIPFSWFEAAILIALGGAWWASAASNLTSSRRRALAASGCALVLTLMAWLDVMYLNVFAPDQGFHALSNLAGPGVFAIDAVNAPLLPLTALLTLVVVAATLKTRLHRFSFARTLLLEAFLLGTLSAKAPAALIPMLALLALPLLHELRERGRAMRVFGLHMALALLLLTSGWLLSLNPAWSLTGYSLMAAGLAVQAGLFPAHCWVIDLFEQASFGTALLALSPLVGVYATARMLSPGAPPLILTVLTALALLTALYTAAMSSVQNDARRFVCYFLLSHASLVFAGICLPNALGLTAGLFMWLSVPLSVLGLGLTVRSLEARTGRLSLQSFLGFHAETPTLAAVFLITGLAAVGFPGTLGFFGFEMLTDAATQSAKAFGLLVIASAALSGIAVLRVYARLFLGARTPSGIDLQVRRVELAGLLVLVLLLIGGTVWPQLALDARHEAAEQLLSQRKSQTAPTLTAHSP